MEERPCCAAAAARKIKHIQIDDSEIGITSLDEIMNKVKEINLPNELEIGKSFLERIKIYNYIPSNFNQEYQIGLFNEYNRRFKNDH